MSLCIEMLPRSDFLCAETWWPWDLRGANIGNRDEIPQKKGREGTRTDADGKSDSAESSQAYTQNCPEEWGFFNIILVH